MPKLSRRPVVVPLPVTVNPVPFEPGILTVVPAVTLYVPVMVTFAKFMAPVPLNVFDVPVRLYLVLLLLPLKVPLFAMLPETPTVPLPPVSLHEQPLLTVISAKFFVPLLLVMLKTDV